MGKSDSKMILATVVLSLAHADVARADAIMPPPKDCAEGSVGTSSHCGPECLPRPCNSDDDCSEKKKVCRPTRLCIDAGERTPCGRVPYKLRNKKHPYRVATGKCPDKGNCARGTCVPAKRCVTPSAAPPKPRAEPPKPAPAKPAPAKPAATPPQKPSSSWCQVGSSAGSPGLMILVLLLLLGRMRRRR